jgi:sugar lactone lactonase YvrE
MVMPAVSRPLHALSAALIITLASGCGGDGGGGTGPVGTGNLSVAVTQPGIASASAHVSGPAGYSHSLTATTTLTGIPVGTYTITADSAELPDTIVGATVFRAQVAGNPATVTKDDTSRAAVTYSFAHLRGALWMASPENEAVVDFGVDHLRSQGTAVAQTELFGLFPNGIAIDEHGLMWISAVSEDTLRAFTIAERSAHGLVKASHKLQSPALGTPEQMAFDRNGTLWVSDFANGLFGFSAAQLSAGGSGITPAYHLTDTSSANPGMQSIAFDREGNAWVAEEIASQIVEFSAAQLTTSGSVAPAVRHTLDLRNPVDLTFDAHQNLWVAYNPSGVLMYTAAQIAVSGALVSTIGLSTPVPQGLAFDDNGSVWVSNGLNATIDVYSASTLTPGPAMLVQRISPDLGQYSSFVLGKLAFDPWIAAAQTPSQSIHQSLAHSARASTAHN